SPSISILFVLSILFVRGCCWGAQPPRLLFDAPSRRTLSRSTRLGPRCCAAQMSGTSGSLSLPMRIGLGSAGVPPAIFGLWPETLHACKTATFDSTCDQQASRRDADRSDRDGRAPHLSNESSAQVGVSSCDSCSSAKPDSGGRIRMVGRAVPCPPFRRARSDAPYRLGPRWHRSFPIDLHPSVGTARCAVRSPQRADPTF